MSKILDIILRTKKQGRGIKEGRDEMGRFTKSTKENSRAAKAWSKSWQAAGSGVKKGVGVAKKALKTLAVGSVGALAASTREFVNFNHAMSQAWTMMDVGRGEFRRLRSQVVDLSTELGVAKVELAQGFYQALSAGVPKDNVIDFLRTAGNISVVDPLADVETAIDGITTVLNSFGIEAEQQSAVADKLFTLVANGKTNFGQLAASISQAAPDAAAMGVELNELLAAAGSITKQGIPTATAMIVIRNAMMGLNAELGDGWGKTRTFQEALEEVAKSAEYSQNALRKIFGAESLKGINALTGANFGSAVKDLESAEDSANKFGVATQKVTSEVAHWLRLWQTLKAFTNDLGREFDERIRHSVTAIVNKLNEIRKGDAFKSFAENLAKGAISLGERIAAGVSTAIEAWQSITSSDGLKNLGEGLKNILIEAVGTMFITGLELVKGSIGVFVGVSRAMAVAFKEEVMKMDFMKGARTKAAAKALEEMSREEVAEQFGEEAAGHAGPLPESGFQRRAKRQTRMRFLQENPELAAQLASMGNPEEIDEALNDARNSFDETKSNIGERVGESGGRIAEDVEGAVGFNPVEVYQKTLGNLQSMRSSAEQAANAAQKGEEEVVKSMDKMAAAQERFGFRIVLKMEQYEQKQKELEEKLNNLPI